MAAEDADPKNKRQSEQSQNVEAEDQNNGLLLWPRGKNELRWLERHRKKPEHSFKGQKNGTVRNCARKEKIVKSLSRV